MSELYGEPCGKFLIFVPYAEPVFPDFIKTGLPDASSVGIPDTERNFILKNANSSDGRIILVLTADKRPVFVFGSIYRWIGSCISFVPDVSLSSLKFSGDLIGEMLVSPAASRCIRSASGRFDPDANRRMLDTVSRLLNLNNFFARSLYFGLRSHEISMTAARFALEAASMCGVKLTVNYDFPMNVDLSVCDVALFAVFIICALVFCAAREESYIRLSFYCDKRNNYYAEMMLDHEASLSDFLAVSEAAARDNMYFSLIDGVRAVMIPSKKEMHYLQLKAGMEHIFGIGEEFDDGYFYDHE